MSQASGEQELLLQERYLSESSQASSRENTYPALTAPGQESQSLQWLPHQFLSAVKEWGQEHGPLKEDSDDVDILGLHPTQGTV